MFQKIYTLGEGRGLAKEKKMGCLPSNRVTDLTLPHQAAMHNTVHYSMLINLKF